MSNINIGHEMFVCSVKAKSKDNHWACCTCVLEKAGGALILYTYISSPFSPTLNQNRDHGLNCLRSTVMALTPQGIFKYFPIKLYFEQPPARRPDVFAGGENLKRDPPFENNYQPIIPFLLLMFHIMRDLSYFMVPWDNHITAWQLSITQRK